MNAHTRGVHSMLFLEHSVVVPVWEAGRFEHEVNCKAALWLSVGGPSVVESSQTAERWCTPACSVSWHQTALWVLHSVILNSMKPEDKW